MIPFVTTQPTHFTIDGLPSNTPAWDVTNIDELLKPAPRRSADGTVIVGAHGRLASRLWGDATTRILEWCVYGDRDWVDTPYADVRVGLETNVRHLIDQIYDLPATVDHTRLLVLTLPTGSTMSGDVQVRSFDWAATGPVIRAVTELFLPAGELTLDGS